MVEKLGDIPLTVGFYGHQWVSMANRFESTRINRTDIFVGGGTGYSATHFGTGPSLHQEQDLVKREAGMLRYPLSGYAPDLSTTA